LQLGLLLRDVCRDYDIPFIVNDDTDLAEALNADGIHVGQDDRSPKELREKFPDKLIGLSISNESDLDNSPVQFIDYIGAGPIFETPSKEDAKKVVGTEWITVLKNRLPNIPIVGIGGITPENAQEVLDAGADGVAIISAITKSANIKRAVNKL